jgi:hypothetical protein
MHVGRDMYSSAFDSYVILSQNIQENIQENK